MVKFNLKIANDMLKQKVERYLTYTNYETPEGSKATFKIKNGLATYQNIPVALKDDECMIIYELPDNAPEYAKVIRYRIISSCDDLKIQTMRVRL